MNTSLRIILTAALALLAALAGCEKADDAGQAASNQATTEQAAAPAASPAAAPADGAWHGTVAETMDAGSYTYVLLDTDGDQRWVAGPKTTVAVGDKVVMQPGMEMRDFHSETLDRTFPSVWFVGGIEPDDGHAHGGAAMGDHPAAENPAGGMPGMAGGMGGMGGDASSHMSTENAGVQGVEPAADGLTVAAIHERAAGLAGQTVKVRGRVVKYTPNIMGTNWVHIQDGTGETGVHDLTVTTSARVKVGDLVLVEGPLSVNKDFGAGYRYDVIVENADVTIE